MRDLFEKQISGQAKLPVEQQLADYTYFGTRLIGGEKILYAVSVETVVVSLNPNDPSKTTTVPITLFMPMIEDEIDKLSAMYEQVDLAKGTTDERVLNALKAFDGIPFFVNRSRKPKEQTNG